MNISQIASPSEHLIDVRRGRSWGEGARVFTQNWAMYSAVLAFGVALIFALLFSNPPEGGAVNWPLAAIALGLLSGGMIVFVLLSAKVHTRSREVGLLERRLAGEASASRVLAGIKLLGVAESEGDVKGSETGLAGAVRMATGYSAAIVSVTLTVFSLLPIRAMRDSSCNRQMSTSRSTETVRVRWQHVRVQRSYCRNWNQMSKMGYIFRNGPSGRGFYRVS